MHCASAAQSLARTTRSRGKIYRAQQVVHPTAALLIFHHVYAPMPRSVDLDQVLAEPVWKYLSNSHFEEERVAGHLGTGFSWERRRLACSRSGQDGRAPRGFGNGHDPQLRLFASQIAKMRIAGTEQGGLDIDTDEMCSYRVADDRAQREPEARAVEPQVETDGQTQRASQHGEVIEPQQERTERQRCTGHERWKVIGVTRQDQ